jgi:uncharacterized protein (TIGR03437 family)
MIKGLSSAVFLIGSITFTLWAQPVVPTGGIVNAASYSLPGLPNSSIGQGSMFIVFGTALGATSNLNDARFPLPTTQGLLGTSIKVAVGGTTVDAIMIYTTPTQVAAVLPSSTPIGAGTLTLTANGRSSSTDIRVVRSSFGTFTANSAGSGPSILENFIAGGPNQINGVLTPARPGQTEILWGTGLGPVSVEVWVGNRQARVTYAGRSGCCTGIDQVVFETPAGISGCYVIVAVKAGGVVGNFTSMAIAPGTEPICSDANGIPASDLTAVLSGSIRLGRVDLSRTKLKVNAGALGTIDASSDVAAAQFGRFTAQQVVTSRGLAESPSVGSCAVSTFRGLNPNPIDPIRPALLDAGASLSVSGPGGAKTVPRLTSGLYSGTLGGVPLEELLTGTPRPDYLSPGTYTISNGNGAAVGAFSGQLTLPPHSQISEIPRTSDLTITWTGGSPNGFTVISGIGIVATTLLGPSADSPGAAFLCVAPAGAGTFTIPSVVLQALPASSTTSLLPTGFLLVGSAGAPVKFTAPNLDAGYLTFRTLIGNNVIFR